jgi:hypothetical protein
MLSSLKLFSASTLAFSAVFVLCPIIIMMIVVVVVVVVVVCVIVLVLFLVMEHQ